jgi:molybdopterin-binding protein
MIGVHSTADIKVVGSPGVRGAVTELMQQFEGQTGHKVVADFDVFAKVGGGGTPAANIAAPSRLVFRNNRLRRDIAMAAPFSWIGMDRSKLLRYVPYRIAISQIHREGSKHMNLSARNVLKGKIVEIARASTMTRVSLDIGGTIVNAAITTVAVDDLKLAVGKEAYAVVDATNVMVGID